MLTLRIGFVRSWIVVKQLDVRNQRRSRKDRLKQIVAQQRVIGGPFAERLFERVDIVEAFAGINAFAKEILIDVGSRRGIRIDASIAGEYSREARLRGALKRNADARLQNGVTPHHAVGVRIEVWPVERVKRRPN